MGMQRSGGFTIIETMLFLAISGVLIVTLIAGTGASINVQRYRDAVETFKSHLQDQYSALSSVENDRDNSWKCDAQAQTQTSGDEIRGQSDCILLGRYVTVVNSDISTYTILGRSKTSQSTVGNDIDKIKANYILNVSTVNQDKTQMEWGTQIAWPSSGSGLHSPTTSRSIGILVVRSPDSGQIYTFTTDTVATEPSSQALSDMLIAGSTIPGQGGQTICVDSNGLFVTADQSIYVSTYATGPSSIETRSNAIILSLGGNTQC